MNLSCFHREITSTLEHCGIDKKKKSHVDLIKKMYVVLARLLK